MWSVWCCRDLILSYGALQVDFNLSFSVVSSFPNVLICYMYVYVVGNSFSFLSIFNLVTLFFCYFTVLLSEL